MRTYRYLSEAKEEYYRIKGQKYCRVLGDEIGIFEVLPFGKGRPRFFVGAREDYNYLRNDWTLLHKLSRKWISEDWDNAKHSRYIYSRESSPNRLPRLNNVRRKRSIWPVLTAFETNRRKH